MITDYYCSLLFAPIGRLNDNITIKDHQTYSLVNFGLFILITTEISLPIHLLILIISIRIDLIDQPLSQAHK